jgi:hypothetical protein
VQTGRKWRARSRKWWWAHRIVKLGLEESD